MTLEATMIENSPELRKMYYAMAAKQESPLVFKFKYVLTNINPRENPFLFRIPTDVFVAEKPLLARWIHDRNHWRQDGYVDYKYTPGKYRCIWIIVHLLSFRYSNDFIHNVSFWNVCSFE